jgi:uncharacterized protein YdeI (BOF family)
MCLNVTVLLKSSMRMFQNAILSMCCTAYTLAARLHGIRVSSDPFQANSPNNEDQFHYSVTVPASTMSCSAAANLCNGKPITLK